MVLSHQTGVRFPVGPCHKARGMTSNFGLNPGVGGLRKILSQKFFDRHTLKVARELLGKVLVRRFQPTVDKVGMSRDQYQGFLHKSGSVRCSSRSYEIVGIITEVEAYIGPNDQASHASRLWRGLPRATSGKTKRTEVMFGNPGYWYIYMIYGIHYCLNIVTEKKGYPAAILIRSIYAASLHKNLMMSFRLHIKGPGRVCKYFKIDKQLNEKPANRKTGLWIEDWGIKINPRHIRRGRRIGVEYAGKWKEKLWRFYLRDKIEGEIDCLISPQL